MPSVGHRERKAIAAVACPYCGAKKGEPCRVNPKSYRPGPFVHTERRNEWRRWRDSKQQINPKDSKLNATEPRLTWRQTAPEPGGVYAAECRPYSFEICRMPDNTGYVLQMWQLRPEDWPLLFWEMDGYNLEEAKTRAERLADQHVPAIT